MPVPAFAPIPPSDIRTSLGSEEWAACLDAWTALADLYLRTTVELFTTAISDPAFSAFARSYYHEAARIRPVDETLRNPRAHLLRRKCFLLMQRCFKAVQSLEFLADLDFLSDFCRVHLKSADLARLLTSIWNTKRSKLQISMQKWKLSTIDRLESSTPASAEPDLNQVAPILHGCPAIAVYVLTGTDFLDASVSAYSNTTDHRLKKAIVMVIYLGLSGCCRVENPNVGLLSDHFYSMEAQADSKPGSPSLLADLVTNTPMTKRIRRTIPASSEARIAKLLDSLATYRMPSIARPRTHVHRKIAKGKGKQRPDDREMHVHRMSLVTQLQDLFPDLGPGFLLRLLDEYRDDVEQVTAHLLDDSLPTHLESLDRNEQAPIFEEDEQDAIEHLAPRSTPPLPNRFVPDRRNVHDDDEFDRLDFDTSRLHIGKKEDTVSSASQPNKSAILSALATFDADDDERDDTYDIEDVGGTIDTAHPDGEDARATPATFDENDVALFRVFDSTPESFGRSAETRRSHGRALLKQQTGMTDEAIEGWAIMLRRDPARLRRLAAHVSDNRGRQNDLAHTAYREGWNGAETEDSATPVDRGGFAGRGRGGRGRGGGGGGGGRGRGRGGNVAGPSTDAGTAAAQRRKEASKGSRANHNRRDQRARKMARGGFPG